MKSNGSNQKIQRRTYLLDGKSEENIAMAMAVTSRSPLPFDKILSQINDRKSSDFLEKFYITYGHGSIADTAFIHIAIENISQIAVKELENTRLGAYQEKSTRYQILDRKHVVYPKEIVESKFAKEYHDTINMLFDLYDDFVEILLEKARIKDPRKKGEKKGVYENRIRIPVIDRCRLILPVSVMCNVGLTMSARSIEYTIAKLLSNPISEVQDLGRDIKKVAIKKLPILVKYANKIDYFQETQERISTISKKNIGIKVNQHPKNKPVDLVSYDKNALDKVITTVFERYSGKSYKTIKSKVRKMSQKQKQKVFDDIIGKRTKRHDKPLRELEYTDYVFDIVCDYGAFKDLQRHRMTTQTWQKFTTDLGYIEPLNLKETGREKEYHEVMKKTAKVFNKISKEMPLLAQYIIPMAYRRRFMMKMNLREAIYLIELRSSKQGHISYRRIANQMWDAINKVHPYFAKHIKVDKEGI